MTNYNFLNLTPIEFEELSRDILQVRENLLFESFKEARDGGIDFRYKDSIQTIVLQAKRYEHFKDLKRVLSTQEVSKVKTLNPSRYILVCSIDFTPSQKNEIMALFKGFLLQESDVLGKRDLNNLLSQPEYAKIRKIHYKLWMTGTDLLQDLIEQITYRKELNLAKAELEIVKAQSKYYVQNKSFLETLDILEDNKVVLISGTPGSGKTTLGRALISYYLAKEGFDELVYISEGISQGWSLFKDNCKQIFFFDDFLGSIAFTGFARNEDSILNKFIEKIKASEDKILILTTREYVLRQAQLQFSALEKNHYNLSKCIVEPGIYTQYIKAKILYNHLYFSDLHPKQISWLLRKENYWRIVQHNHYTPRLIENYIKFSSKEDTVNEYRFYKDFINYLDHPYEFWNDVYNKQSPASQLLLLVLFSLNDPVCFKDLKIAWQSAANLYVKKFSDLIISPDTFAHSIKELSDTFIKIDLDEPFYVVRFQNASIKDFLLGYLRNKENLIEILIQSAAFYNQLIFAFDTRINNIQDQDSDEPLYGEKIIVPEKMRQIYLDKFITDFDTLKLSTVNPVDYTDLKTHLHSLEDLLTLKMLDLKKIFGMEHSQVKALIINKFNDIISPNEEKHKILTKDAMLYFPDIIKIVQPFISIDPDRLLHLCYKSATFTSEFDNLYDVGKIYPEAFEKLLNNEAKNIKKEIKNTILDDIDYFMADANDEEIDHLFEWTYPEVFGKYKIKESKKFESEMRELAERFPVQEADTHEWLEKRKEERIEEEKTEIDIENLFLSLQTHYNQDILETDEELYAYLDQLNEYDVRTKNLVKEFDNTDIGCFTTTTFSLQLALDYFQQYESVPKEKEIFWQRMYKLMYSKLNAPYTLSPKELEIFLYNLAASTLMTDTDEFNDKMLKKLVWMNPVQDIVLSEILPTLSPLLIKKSNWYQFINRSTHMYLAAQWIKSLEVSEKRKFYQSFADKLCRCGDPTVFLNFLFEMDKHALIKDFALPQLKEFIDQLDFSNSKKLIISYCKVTEIQIDLELNEDGYFNETGGGSSDFIKEDLINLLEINCHWHNLSSFFDIDQIADEDFSSKKSIYLKLFDYVKKNCHNENYKFFDLKLTKELEKDEFYDLLKSLGMEQHIVMEINNLTTKVIELENYYANSLNNV